MNIASQRLFKQQPISEMKNPIHHADSPLEDNNNSAQRSKLSLHQNLNKPPSVHNLTMDTEMQTPSQTSNSRISHEKKGIISGQRRASLHNHSVDYHSSRSKSTLDNDSFRYYQTGESNYGSNLSYSHLTERDESKGNPAKSTNRSHYQIEMPTEREGKSTSQYNSERSCGSGVSSAAEIAEKYKSLLKAYEYLVKINCETKEELEKEKRYSKEQKVYIEQLKEIIEERVTKSNRGSHYNLLGSKNAVNVKEDKPIGERIGDEEIVLEKTRSLEKVIDKLREENRQTLQALEEAGKEREEILKEKTGLVEKIQELKENLVEKEEYLRIYNQLSSLKGQYQKLLGDYKQLKELSEKAYAQRSLSSSRKVENSGKIDKENISPNVGIGLGRHSSRRLTDKVDSSIIYEEMELLNKRDVDWKKKDNETLLLSERNSLTSQQKLVEELISSGIWSEERGTEKNMMEDNRLSIKEAREYFSNKGTSRSEKQALCSQRSMSTLLIDYLQIIRLQISKLVGEYGSEGIKNLESLVREDKERTGDTSIFQGADAVERNFEAVVNLLECLENEMKRLENDNKQMLLEIGKRLESEKELRKMIETNRESINDSKVSLAAAQEKETKVLKERRKEKEDLMVYQFTAKSLERFVFNEEAVQNIKRLAKAHARIKALKREIEVGNVGDEKSKSEIENLVKIEKKLCGILKGLESQEKKRYDSLYMLERQNTELKEELRKKVRQENQNADEKKEEIKKKRRNSDVARLLEDFRMPITRINFELEQTGKSSQADTELDLSLEVTQ